MCHFVCMLEKVVSHYYFLECSVHVIVNDEFPKKVWMGISGWGELSNFFGIFFFFSTLQIPYCYLVKTNLRKCGIEDENKQLIDNPEELPTITS